MKTIDGKIVEATENELYEIYLKKEYDEVMDFNEFLFQCKLLGTKVIKEGE